ncbi:hypothetical protein GCM10022216_15030 [Sphingobacterium kyonggiense]|uniref:Superfamily III holin-X n=1 Tax=Sphingobacterium kyonggiense TaxID=714075 RepID=A0ABP7YLQ1_9SPHI
MDNQENKIKQIMKMAEVKMPFQDFDEQVLSKIQAIEEAQQRATQSRKYSLISFAFGAIFGIAFNYLVSKALEESVSDIQVKTAIQFASQFIYIIFIIILCHKILRLRELQRTKKLPS